MTSREIASYRLTNQMISGSRCATAAEVVAAMGAMQAQDYPGSLWAIGLRTTNANVTDVEQAIEDRRIVRTWPMRGTLQFVAPGDVRWMLELLGPRVIAAAARRHRELELDESVFAKSEKLIVRALEGGKQLTRPEMMALLNRAGIATANQRGYHILWRHALKGLICFGPREEKQPTFVLLDEWLPPARRRSRDAAVADFALRYFKSHGPATVDDFAWWIGMKKSDAAAAVESISAQLSKVTSNGSIYWMAQDAPKPRVRQGDIHLLPSFDELLIGYTDRSDAVAAEYSAKINPSSNGLLMPLIVKAGRVIGTWNRALKKGKVFVEHDAFTAFGKSDLRAWHAASRRYADFNGATLA